MTGGASYVYAVGRGLTPAAVSELVGIDRAAVRLVDAGEVQAVVSDVDATSLADLAPAERAVDLERIAHAARSHHHVVDAVGREHVVAPFSLGTVYHDDDRVHAVLTAGLEPLRGVLDRLEGRAEWGVKAWDRPEVGNEEHRPARGADYLRGRRDALRRAEHELDAARDRAATLHRALASVAEDARTHRPQDAALSGVVERMLLNGAYLVPVARAEQLTAVVASHDDPRLRVEITGPWVPYSFATVDRP